MTAGPQVAWLPDGQRLHLHHGPIDLVIAAEGPERRAAFARALLRFDTLLSTLVTELDRLRRVYDGTPFADPVAHRMAIAVAPYSPSFVTPMAAVAGAVADEILAAMLGPDLTKVHVNNGGDIAFHLTSGTALTAMGAVGDITIHATDPSRGIATSGWRGRSFSLGIADAVTVVAHSAAAADVAATLIANAVDLPGHPAIKRQPAQELSPDSDLGRRLVTIDVGSLTTDETQSALEAGVATAHDMQRRGLIDAATLCLNGQTALTAPKTGALSHA